MRVHLIISDVHRDVVTLKAFLDKYQGKFSDIWCLGDVTGHGDQLRSADTDESYRILYEGYHLGGKLFCVAGNWEKVALILYKLFEDSQNLLKNLGETGEQDWELIPEVRELFKESELKTTEKIALLKKYVPKPEYIKWISEWQETFDDDDFTLTHGWIFPLTQEHRENYRQYLRERQRSKVTNVFSQQKIVTSHAIVGHTHDPGFFRFVGGDTKWVSLTQDMLGKEIPYNDGLGGRNFRYVLNPGAVVGTQSSTIKGLKTAILLDTENKIFQFISVE